MKTPKSDPQLYADCLGILNAGLGKQLEDSLPENAQRILQAFDLLFKAMTSEVTP